MDFPSVSLVVPCFNESNRIDLMYEGLYEFSQVWKGDYEFVIIDDGSKDGTYRKLKTHSRYFEFLANNKINVIRQRNRGKGGALRLGVLCSEKDFVLTLDADMATRPTELISWLQSRGQFVYDEILIASRELASSKVSDSIVRHIIGKIFNFVIKQSVGLNISDTQCGFKLYKSEVGILLYKELETFGWAHDVEILARAKNYEFEIIEMPIKWTSVAGSKIRIIRDGWKMFWEVIRIRKIIERTFNQDNEE